MQFNSYVLIFVFLPMTFFVNQLNDKFSQEAREIKNLYINDINYLSSYIGLKI